MAELDDTDESIRKRMMEAVEELEQIARWIDSQNPHVTLASVRSGVTRALHSLRNGLTVMNLKTFDP